MVNEREIIKEKWYKERQQENEREKLQITER